MSDQAHAPTASRRYFTRSAVAAPPPQFNQESSRRDPAPQQYSTNDASQHSNHRQDQQWNGPHPQYYEHAGARQQPTYAPHHHQTSSHRPSHHHYQQSSAYLPSANPPFHPSAPLQVQRPPHGAQSHYAQIGHAGVGGADYRSGESSRGGRGGYRGGTGPGRGGGAHPQHPLRRESDLTRGADGGRSDVAWRGAGSSQPEPSRGGYRPPFSRFAHDIGRERQTLSATPEPLSDSSALPTPFARRKKAPRATGSAPPPSEEYLASTLLPPTLLPSGEESLPPLLILDLNNTLLCRKRGSTRGSKHPVVRPYLSTFLQYVCGATEDGQRRWETAVYSSAASHNVLSLLEAVNLIPRTRAHEHEATRKGKPWDARPGEPLNLVWSREKMNLSAAEFTQNVETVKDLGQVWTALPDWNEKRSVLLDDEAMKSAQHPYSHIPIHPFIIDPASVPSSPPPTPRRLNSPDSRSREPTPQPPLTASPTHLPPEHAFYNDTSLLSTIYVLNELRRQANICAWIRQIGLRGLDLQDEEQRVDAGREICKELGIEVRRAWDEDWWERVPSWKPSGKV